MTIVDDASTTSADPILLPEWCRRCGQAIDVCSPVWYRLDLDFVKRRVEGHYNPDDSARCSQCALADADNNIRTELESHLAALIERKRLAGIPDSVTMFHHRSHGAHTHKATNGRFSSDWYFVHVLGPVPQEWTAPPLRITPDDGSEPITLLILGWDIRLDGVHATLRYAWDGPDLWREGRLTVDGWSQVSHSDLMRLMHAARVFHEQAKRGRPLGTMDHSHDDYVHAFRQVVTKLGRPPKSLREFTEVFREINHAGESTVDSFSMDTAKNNFRRWGTTWSDFRKSQL